MKFAATIWISFNFQIQKRIVSAETIWENMVCATNVYLLTVGTLWLAWPHFWSTEKCESQPTDFRLLPNILIKLFIFYFLDLPCNCGNAGHSLLERFAPRKKCFKRKVFKLKQKIPIFCTKSRDKNLIIWVCACTVQNIVLWSKWLGLDQFLLIWRCFFSSTLHRGAIWQFLIYYCHTL